MGDWYEWIADVEATPGSAPELGEALVRWLAADGIIVPELTDCVLGLSDLGYRPGPNYTAAANDDDARFLSWAVNGVDVRTTRTWYVTSEGPHSAICRFCGAPIVFEDESGNPNDAWYELADLMQIWDETGEFARQCGGCARVMNPNDWDWEPPVLAFAYLGLTFWNWPGGLRPEFIAEIGRRLGHRTVSVAAKL